MVNEIKAKAKTWEPMEVDENPLSKLTPEEIKGLFGGFQEDFLDGVEIVTKTTDPNF